MHKWVLVYKQIFYCNSSAIWTEYLVKVIEFAFASGAISPLIRVSVAVALANQSLANWKNTFSIKVFKTTNLKLNAFSKQLLTYVFGFVYEKIKEAMPVIGD